jgi:hypothetical protein
MSHQTFLLPLEVFLLEMGVYRDYPHMFFLGAGASVASGIPSASSCVQDWKKKIYRSMSRDGNASLREIQRWLDRQKEYPAEGAEEEYAFYAEKCYPRQEPSTSTGSARAQSRPLVTNCLP